MKSKRKVVEELKAQGIDASYESGVVMFYNITMPSAKKLCKLLHYTGSYGVKERSDDLSTQ